MPILNWSEMFINDDLGYLYKTYRTNKVSKLLSKKSDVLFNQYINKVGLSKQYLAYIKKVKYNQKMKLAYMEGKAEKGTFAEVSDMELKQFFGKEQKDNIRVLSVKISKSQGYRIEDRKSVV